MHLRGQNPHKHTSHERWQKPLVYWLASIGIIFPYFHAINNISFSSDFITLKLTLPFSFLVVFWKHQRIFIVISKNFMHKMYEIHFDKLDKRGSRNPFFISLSISSHLPYYSSEYTQLKTSSKMDLITDNPHLIEREDRLSLMKGQQMIIFQFLKSPHHSFSNPWLWIWSVRSTINVISFITVTSTAIIELSMKKYQPILSIHPSLFCFWRPMAVGVYITAHCKTRN